MQQAEAKRRPDGFASLHGGLLARKGAAAPAPLADLDTQRRARRGERLGADRRETESPPAPPRSRVSLRLSSRQQRLLRLVAAATDRSQQEILSLALDQHLTRVIGEELGHCKCLRRLVLGEVGAEFTCDKKAAG